VKTVRSVIESSPSLRKLRAPQTGKDQTVYFIAITQLAATAALLVGHFAVYVKDHLGRAR